MTPQEAAARVESLLALFERAKSSDYIGEGVSQLDHALQAASRARAAGAPANEILAALLHDVGHLCAPPDAPSMAGLGVLHHEEVGADHLAGLGLSADVVELVRGHVAAKRYLVGAESGYAARLSEASRTTLLHQGGRMSAGEQRDFEALPLFRALLRVRAWDEAAKQRDLRVEDLSTYAPLLRDHLLPAMSDRQLRRWQRTTLATLVIGYAGYYFCRSNFSVALPLIADELGQHGMGPADARLALGKVASLGVLAYALGKFASGLAAERLGGRRAFLSGMGLSALCTLGFAAGGSLPLFTAAWVANRLVQSLGWVGMVKIASRWFHASAYGAVMGVISLSYLFGDALARGAMGALLARGVGWRELFALAAGLILAILAASAWLLREAPGERGVREPESAPGAPFQAGARESPAQLLHGLLADRKFRLVCGISLGMTLLRETFNTWTPSYFVDAVGLSPSAAASASAVFPLLGGVSVLVTGRLSDRPGARGRVLVLGIALASVALGLLALVPAAAPGGAIALVGVAGFCLIGPYSLLAGAISLDFGGKRASAAAAGVIDGVGYLGGVLAGAGVAGIAGRFGWARAFAALAGVSACTGLLAWLFSRR